MGYGYPTATTAGQLYGPSVQTPTLPEVMHSPIAPADLSDTTGWRRLVDPKNPLVWFGALLAITLGAAGVAGSARVGNVRVSASAGES